jgi:hypothetical protein
MPRVNRDLQRRMAARRERERRRPAGERRYRFGSPEASIETDDAVLGGEVDAEAPAQRSRAVNGPAPAAMAAATRGGVRAHLPFSAYGAEYAYVLGDLRRVGLVIGSLLLILIVLFFLLPR